MSAPASVAPTSNLAHLLRAKSPLLLEFRSCQTIPGVPLPRGPRLPRPHPLSPRPRPRFVLPPLNRLYHEISANRSYLNGDAYDHLGWLNRLIAALEASRGMLSPAPLPFTRGKLDLRPNI